MSKINKVVGCTTCGNYRAESWNGLEGECMIHVDENDDMECVTANNICSDHTEAKKEGNAMKTAEEAMKAQRELVKELTRQLEIISSATDDNFLYSKEQIISANEVATYAFTSFWNERKNFPKSGLLGTKWEESFGAL